MTHDPVCSIEPNPLARECRTCELITKVRADQDRRHAAAELTRMARSVTAV